MLTPGPRQCASHLDPRLPPHAGGQHYQVQFTSTINIKEDNIRQVAEEEDLPCKIGFFLHIPFPPWDMIKIFPWHDLILQVVSLSLSCTQISVICCHFPSFSEKKSARVPGFNFFSGLYMIIMIHHKSNDLNFEGYPRLRPCWLPHWGLLHQLHWMLSGKTTPQNYQNHILHNEHNWTERTWVQSRPSRNACWARWKDHQVTNIFVHILVNTITIIITLAGPSGQRQGFAQINLYMCQPLNEISELFLPKERKKFK